MSDITIRRATLADKYEWLRMRLSLWVFADPQGFEEELDEILTDPQQAVFLALRPTGQPCGFLEATIRKYADGCETGPVGYIEGWYVEEDLRHNGVGASLVRAAEEWARALGMEEMGSDTWLDNDVSIEAHKKLGYEEAERLVHFAKRLN